MRTSCKDVEYKCKKYGHDLFGRQIPAGSCSVEAALYVLCVRTSRSRMLFFMSCVDTQSKCDLLFRLLDMSASPTVCRFHVLPSKCCL